MFHLIVGENENIVRGDPDNEGEVMRVVDEDIYEVVRGDRLSGDYYVVGIDLISSDQLDGEEVFKCVARES